MTQKLKAGTPVRVGKVQRGWNGWTQELEYLQGKIREVKGIAFPEGYLLCDGNFIPAYAAQQTS